MYERSITCYPSSGRTWLERRTPLSDNAIIKRHFSKGLAFVLFLRRKRFTSGIPTI